MRFREHLSWDNYNEGQTLQAAVERYRARFGTYLKAVLADQQEQKKIAKADTTARNAVEGKFGEGKSSYGLGRIRAHLQTTSETVIGLQLLVMNLEKRLRVLFLPVLQWLLSRLAVRLLVSP